MYVSNAQWNIAIFFSSSLLLKSYTFWREIYNFHKFMSPLFSRILYRFLVSFHALDFSRRLLSSSLFPLVWRAWNVEQRAWGSWRILDRMAYEEYYHAIYFTSLIFFFSSETCCLFLRLPDNNVSIDLYRCDGRKVRNVNSLKCWGQDSDWWRRHAKIWTWISSNTLD